jgi:hypothetical protein
MVMCEVLFNYSFSLCTKTTVILQRMSNGFTLVCTCQCPLQGSFSQNSCDYLACFELKPHNFFYCITALIWFPFIIILPWYIRIKSVLNFLRIGAHFCSFTALLSCSPGRTINITKRPPGFEVPSHLLFEGSWLIIITFYLCIYLFVIYVMMLSVSQTI